MTDEQIALARRAVACKGWRWMPGMLAVRVEEPPFVSEGFDASTMLGHSYRVYDVSERGVVRCVLASFHAASTAYAPDLTDPATGGCMLSLLGDSRWMITATLDGFVVGTGRWDVTLVHARVGTLGEACAHALILLPRKRSGVGGSP